VRLYTRNGNDFSHRFPLVVAAIAALPVRSCLIDGEAIVKRRAGAGMSSGRCRSPYNNIAEAMENSSESKHRTSLRGSSSTGKIWLSMQPHPEVDDRPRRSRLPQLFRKERLSADVSHQAPLSE
jgi:hypothetical protein